MSVNFPFCPGSWMVSLCFDPNKDKCTKVEEDQCLKPELHVISKNNTNFTVVLLRVVCQISDFFSLFRLRRLLEMNSRSTTFFSSDVYLVQCLPSLFPFSRAGSGLLPSGTTREASGASQSIPGCLGKKRCRWRYLLGSVLRLLWDDYHVHPLS